MTATKTKNDTASVTASIMTVNVDKNKKPADKPTAKVKPKAIPAPSPAKAGDKGAKKTAEKAADKAEVAVTMSTDAFSKEVLTELQRRSKAIKDSIGKIDSSFETIAFNLHWIYTKQAFKAEGYPNIESYCSEVFGYEKSTCYSLVGIVDRFAKRDEKGALMEAFDERVKGYSVSKLSLMCNLTDAEIDSLKPSMSVRDIKKFVKGLMGKALPELSEGGGALEEEDGGGDTEDSSVIDVDGKVVYDVLIKCKGKDDFEKKAGKINEYAARVFKQHPDAVIEVSYSLPPKKGEKA